MAISVREVVTGSSEGETTVNLGAETEVGDLLLLVNGTDFYTIDDMDTPSGGGTWTQVADATADEGASDFHLRAWWAVVTSGGAQSISVDQPNEGSDDACNHVRIRVLTGADTDDPIDDAAGTETDQQAPSVSPETDGALLCCDVLGGSDTYTSPGSMVAEPQEDCETFSTSDGAHEQLSASGATGTRTWNAGSVGVSVAVRTAAGATDLTAADASHAQTADSPTLTQTHEITAASAGHTQTAASPDLAQQHQLTAAGARHGQTADGAELTQLHQLTAAGATHGQAADGTTVVEPSEVTALLTASTGVRSTTRDVATRSTTDSSSTRSTTAEVSVR